MCIYKGVKANLNYKVELMLIALAVFHCVCFLLGRLPSRVA